MAKQGPGGLSRRRRLVLRTWVAHRAPLRCEHNCRSRSFPQGRLRCIYGAEILFIPSLTIETEVI